MTSRRVHQRFHCDLPLSIVLPEETLAATCANVSLGGMYLVTSRDLAYGTEVTIRFRLPAMKEDANAKATVRWKKPDGIGVQFGSLRAIEVWALNQFFKGLAPDASS